MPELIFLPTTNCWALWGSDRSELWPTGVSPLFFPEADVKLTKGLRMRAAYLGEKGELRKNLADFLEKRDQTKELYQHKAVSGSPTSAKIHAKSVAGCLPACGIVLMDFSI